jgi:serine protease
MRRLFLPFCAASTLTALLIATPASAAVGIASARPAFVPHQVLVKLEGARPRAISLPAGAGVLETAAALRRDPRVVYAEPNYIATASAGPQGGRRGSNFAPPNDSGSLGGALEAAPLVGGWANKQWNFLPSTGTATPELPTSPGGIDAVAAWRHLAEAGDPGAAGVVVAVLDTGIAYRSLGSSFRRSPDFAGRRKFVPGADFIDDDHLPLDENGHGTHVAGTIGESTNNRIGVTGLAYQARLMPVRVLDAEGRGNALAISKGIQFAIRHHAAVINMSFNFECGEKVPLVDAALAQAHTQGIVLVASAGNLDSEQCVSEPATAPGVIGVGGTTEGGCLGDYSPSGGAIDIVAPGGGEPVPGCPSILARPVYQVTLKHDSTIEFGIPGTYVGTSMAAAHVSGVAAMLLALQKRRGHELNQGVAKYVTKRMLRTARNIGLPRNQQGAGLLDAGRATLSGGAARSG